MNNRIMMITWALYLFSQSWKISSVTSCRTWNRLLLGCNPGQSQVSFILCTTSDTLPTSVNLRRWHIQCGTKCTLCGDSQSTTAHALDGCSVALSQGHFTYHHDNVLHCLATELLKYFAWSSLILLYANLPGMRASDCPRATIPSSLLVTSYRPDLVIYNKENNSVFMLELSCPLDSTCHLETVSRVKQNIWRLFLSSSVLDLPFNYELSVLGHYLPSSLSSLKNCVNWMKRKF